MKLSFRAQAEYQQAEDAINAGDMEYAQKLMEKNVLFDILTNRWCPSIWNEADKCPVTRSGRGTKYSLTDDSCEGISGELLSAVTGKMDPSKPPDFYRHVQGVGSGESYGHK